ncbi:MAG: hypothetical protein ACK4M7_09035 [Burkholderiales bacterium]
MWGINTKLLLLRCLFREIAAGNTTFSKKFFIQKDHYFNEQNEDYIHRGYPPIENGGTKRARDSVYTITKIGARCHDMSDDSEEGN